MTLKKTWEKVNNIGDMTQSLVMMVASTVLHNFPSKNEYQQISFPTLLLMLVSGANKVGYIMYIYVYAYIKKCNIYK